MLFLCKKLIINKKYEQFIGKENGIGMLKVGIVMAVNKNKWCDGIYYKCFCVKIGIIWIIAIIYRHNMSYWLEIWEYTERSY